MKYKPAVFAVEDTYQIMLPAAVSSLMWVRVGDRCFYDDVNGILRSSTDMHRVSVPMALLDEARAYTICERRIRKRKPYFSEPLPAVETTYAFRPVPATGEIRAYMIADTHDRVAETIRAVKTFGKADFLLFNGDIANHNDDMERVLRVFEIAGEIAGGEIPMVFARGNHDTRGRFAERYTDYTPHAEGRSYYWFRLGRIWGLVLDCGEDKDDSHPEYGGTVCCHDFRLRETAYLERLIRQEIYEQPDVDTRIVVVHDPFTYRDNPPFDIEEEIYTRWARLLEAHVHPDVILAGHLHQLAVSMPGSALDHRGQPCPVVVGSKVGKGYFAGTGVSFREDGVQIAFTDSDGACIEERFIPKTII